MKLKNQYTIYYSSGVDHRKNMTKEDFELHLNPLYHFDTAEDFWEMFLCMKLPTQLHLKSKIFMFKADILPTWEHEGNKGGGRIYIKIPLNKETDEIWQNVVLEFLCGFGNKSYLDKAVNGIELSVRQADMICIAVWVNARDFRLAREIFFHLKRNCPLPKFIEFDFAEHPMKYFNKNG